LPWLKDLVEEIAEQEGFDIGLQTPNNLPPVPYDPDKMRRAIINLLTNSVQALKAKLKSVGETSDGFTPHIGIEVGLTDDDLTFIIFDNGMGMSPETHRQAFEPLLTTRSRGTGLGLSIVKKIIEEHNGTISMKSRVGEGTRILLAVPCTLPLESDHLSGAGSNSELDQSS
jgi:two-component system sensor histidine kinase HydH